MANARFQGRMVYCSTVDTTVRMLETVLGFKRAYEADGDVSVTIETVEGAGTTIEFYLHPGNSRSTDELGTFVVDDADDTALQMIAWGCEATGGPSDTPWGVREAYLRDGDGHEITLRGPG